MKLATPDQVTVKARALALPRSQWALLGDCFCKRLAHDCDRGGAPKLFGVVLSNFDKVGKFFEDYDQCELYAVQCMSE